MTGWRLGLLWGSAVAASVGATLLLAPRPEDPAASGPAAKAMAPPQAVLASDAGPPLDAAQISSGRLVMDRMPVEVGTALETFSEEIVRNAQDVQSRQVRITGTCAPGSAIRVIGEDGTVRCQALPRGVASVSALLAIPRMSSTATEAASVPGGAGRYQSAGPDDYLVAPISLPDGAIVSSLSFTYYDDSPELDTAAFLYRSDDQPIASVASSEAEDRVRTKTSQSVQSAKVDTGRYAYFVYFQTSSRAGARLMPIAASVAYRLP